MKRVDLTYLYMKASVEPYSGFGPINLSLKAHHQKVQVSKNLSRSPSAKGLSLKNGFNNSKVPNPKSTLTIRNGLITHLAYIKWAYSHDYKIWRMSFSLTGRLNSWKGLGSMGFIAMSSNNKFILIMAQ